MENIRLSPIFKDRSNEIMSKNTIISYLMFLDDWKMDTCIRLMLRLNFPEQDVGFADGQLDIILQ